MATADKIIVATAEIAIDCPGCGHENGGWVEDPRGTVFECDECELAISVPQGTPVEIK